jgi:hypothetical protein
VVGNAASVVGDVKMRNATVTTPRAVALRQRLAWGDRIDTGKKSQLQILLLDRSTFGIGASSRVQIDRFVYDPDAGGRVRNAGQGRVAVLLGTAGGREQRRYPDPAGRIGIRGTALDLLVGEEAKDIAEDEDSSTDADVDSDEDEATLVVLRGPGREPRADCARRGRSRGCRRARGARPAGPCRLHPAQRRAADRTVRHLERGLAKVQDELAPEVARASGRRR